MEKRLDPILRWSEALLLVGFLTDTLLVSI
jgi:hypothetical protein